MLMYSSVIIIGGGLGAYLPVRYWLKMVDRLRYWIKTTLLEVDCNHSVAMVYRLIPECM